MLTRVLTHRLTAALAPGYSTTLYTRKRFMSCKRAAVLIVLPVLFVAAAVAQNPAPGAEAPAANAPKALPGLDDPTVSGAQVDLGTYIIGANDILNVEVFGNRDFTKLYPVRTDGMITVPLTGEMRAEGLTPLQLTRQLAEALREKLRDPEVSVTVWEVRSKKYTITGQVRRPGPFPLIRTTTVFEALTEAGGFLDNFSNQKDILILRGTERLHFNYKDYVKGKNLDKNIPLQNGDTIIVK
jgi:polysaccharide biosynthesis/export protein